MRKSGSLRRGPREHFILGRQARARLVHSTGRNVQFNAKISQNTFDAIYAVTEQQGWVLVETLLYAMAAILREQERTKKIELKYFRDTWQLNDKENQR